MQQNWRVSFSIQPHVPSTLVEVYLRFALENGYTRSALFSRNFEDIYPPATDADNWPIAHYERLLARLLTLFPGSALGFQVGMRLPPKVLGQLGTAMLASPTLGDALMQCQRFWCLYGMGTSLVVQIIEGSCVITLDTLPHVPLHLRQTTIECIMAGAYRLVSALVGQQVNGVIHFDWNEPVYSAQIKSRVSSVIYNSCRSQYRFPSRFLELSTKHSDPLKYGAAVDACLLEEESRKAAESSVSHLVLQSLNLEQGSYASFNRIARELAVSPRTLRRRLAEEGVQFSQLLEATQFADARKLLDNDFLEIGEIAFRLGYRERASFTRAFRRWYGESPSQYRSTMKKLKRLSEHDDNSF